MIGPEVTDNDFTETAGVIHVANVVNQARCIWRATPLRDVGIDGQIEYVTPSGIASGRLIGVQIKSGASYFTSERGDAVRYNVPSKHAAYWDRFPVPVVLVLLDPTRSLAIWVDARAALRRGENPIVVPVPNVFDARSVLSALQASGPLPADSNPAAVLEQMVSARTGNPQFNTSFFELFCHGLTDLAYSLYFNMDLVMEIVEANVHLDGAATTVALAAREFEFLDQYVTFLVAQDIARVDFDAWQQASVERGMMGSFIAPLTRRGRELVRHINAMDFQLLGAPGNLERITEERPIQILALRMLERAHRMRQLMTAMGEPVSRS